MNAWTLLQTLRGAGVTLAVDGESVRYQGARGAMRPHLLAELKAHKPQVLEILAAEAEGRRLAAEVERLEAVGRHAEASDLFNSAEYLAAVDRLLDLMEADAKAGETPVLSEVA